MVEKMSEFLPFCYSFFRLPMYVYEIILCDRRIFLSLFFALKGICLRSLNLAYNKSTN